MTKLNTVGLFLERVCQPCLDLGLAGMYRRYCSGNTVCGGVLMDYRRGDAEDRVLR